MHIIDLSIMKLAKSKSTIEDFKSLLRFCKEHKDQMGIKIVNGNVFFIPEDEYFCNLEKFPAFNRDPDAFYSPVICTASGNNYLMVKACGDNFLLNQYTSISSCLLALNNYYEDVRILDASFDGDYSEYLIVFNGSSSN